MKGHGLRGKNTPLEIQHLKTYLKVPTASRATFGKVEKSGKEIHTLYSELFQNILTTEKVCKSLKKRTDQKTPLVSEPSSLFTEDQHTQFNYYMLYNGSSILNMN